MIPILKHFRQHNNKYLNSFPETMQKTILFGKKLPLAQNIDPKNDKIKCHNCLKLQALLTELQQSIKESHRNINEQNLLTRGDSAVVSEMVELKNKFMSLKKKLEVVEKESDQLFEENSQKSKQISRLRRLLEEIEKERENAQPLLLDNDEAEDLSCCQLHEKERAELTHLHEIAVKEMKVELFVWRQKTESMEVLMREQNDEIVQLKEILKKRNKLQEQQHVLLETLCC